MASLVLVVLASLALADTSIYSDELDNGWNNWSWATTNFSSTTVVHSGKYSISATMAAWQAVYFEHSAVKASPYGAISFWINGGTSGGQRLRLIAEVNGSGAGSFAIPPLTAGSWTHYAVPLAALGAANTSGLTGFLIQDGAGDGEPTFYIDDVSLTPPLTPPTVQSYQYKPAVVGGGGYVSGIVCNPNFKNVIYARTDIGGCYRWIEATQTWTPLLDWVTNPIGSYMGVESIAVDPTSSTTVFAACGYGSNQPSAILNSTNLGATWNVNPAPFVVEGNSDGRGCGERLNVDPNLPSKLYYGSNLSGLYASADRAKTWTSVSSFPVTSTANGVGIAFVQFIKSSGVLGKATPMVYVGVSQTGNHLYRSADGGITWSVIPTNVGSTLMPIRAAQDGVGNMFITFADNAGPNGASIGVVKKLNLKTLAITDVTPKNGYSYGGFAGISVSKQNPKEMAVATLDQWWHHNEIFRSLDGGATWVPTYATASFDYAAIPWMDAHGSPADPSWITDVEIDPFNSNRLFHVSGGGVLECKYFTILGPLTYEAASVGIEETVVLGAVSPPTGPLVVTALGDIGGFARYSLDVSPPVADYFNPVGSTNTSVDFAETKPAFMVRAAYFNGTLGAYSTDSGAHWTQFTSEPSTATTTNGPGTITVNADGTAIIWAPAGSNQYVSFDAGNTWTPCVGGTTDNYGYPAIADRADPMRFYIYDAANGSFLVSTNKGASFSVASSSLSQWGGRPVTVFGMPGDIWIPGTDALYHSTDYGDTWTPVVIGAAQSVGFGVPAAGHSYPAIYYSGEIDGVLGMYRSDDGGSTWFLINDANHWFGGIGLVVGDRRTYGKFYLGCGGRGLHYGTIAYRLSGIFCSSTSVVGGASASATVSLLANAPVGGAVLSLTSDCPEVSVPATITVVEGNTAAIFTMKTAGVNKRTMARITVSDGTSLMTLNLTLDPDGSGSR
jgi:hypothetical protein